MQKVYFDNAATTQPHPEVITAMLSVMKSHYGNPSSVHGFGRSSKTQLEQARKNIARYFGVQSSELIFTSGGTEADNLVLQGAVRDLGITDIITSQIEHHAVLHTIEFLAQHYDVTVHYVNITDNGVVDYLHLETLLQVNPLKTLVSLMHVNNEIGTILDLERVSVLCKNAGALFHSDMVQSFGRYELKEALQYVDFAAASGHKFHGPKGVGFAFVKKNSGIKALLVGGEQERGYRAGTESVHNIVGMEVALRSFYDNYQEEQKTVSALKMYFVQKIAEAIPDVCFNGNSNNFEENTYTLVNVSLPLTPEKATILLFHLDLQGIACSRGSACQSGSIKVSHVLQQFLSEEALQKPALRFSFSKYNTKSEVDYVVQVLKDFVQKV